MEIYFNNALNRFELCYEDMEKYSDYYVKQYERIIKILQEFINLLPVEFNDFVVICRELKINLQSNVPYYFLNQELILQKIRVKFGI